ncbi:MAG: bifunctional acyl-ACP--phospholipid O-acyltransferase/long-chain-fatty-acid--ACP ligase [Bryobacteraceae bacterium]|nr:bifunctional acyl-ACP--phospholipid O-acyltransferase/long-chain-fatty-acid--ACP ligase [Bryobacteraceae bacterium]MDW8378646.1 bifunctional acyl-ACP--phospholipid O-acyltransferase/long-chain-fatty-acid--ACP ligase [Bryobacterales bacterium]
MLRLLARVFLRLIFRLEVSGVPPLQPRPRMLVVSNHESFADGVLIQSFLPFAITWVVHSQIARKWYFRLVLRWVSHILVDAANPLSMKRVLQAVEAGVPVGIFPEGRVTVTGSLMKIYDGTAFLAARSGATILPVHIEGCVNSWFSRMRPPYPVRWRPRVKLTFLPETSLPVAEASSAKQRRRMAGEAMRRMMQENMVVCRTPKTLFDALLDAIELHGRRAPILEDIRPKTDTYGELLKASLALGRLISKLTAEGERVGVLLPNAGPAVATLFGLFAFRRIPAMLNYTAGVDGMQSAIDLACLRLILTSRAFVEKAKLTGKLAQLKNVRTVYLEDLRPMFGLRDKLWLLFWALWFPRQVRRPTRPTDPAVVLFTSGSEGKPKGVVLSHDNILANIRQVAAVIEFSNKDRFFVAMPMFHSFGLTACTILPVVSGTPIFLYPSPLHYRMVPELTYDRDCTVLFGTPTFLKNYARFANPYDFYCLRYVVAGAEKLTEDVRSLYLDRFGLRILEGYGATECSPVVAVNSPKAYRRGSVGQLLPGMEARLAPVAGIERGGRLHVRGPNVMLGYLKYDAPGVLQAPVSEFGDGWYDTGDLVEIDAEGFLFILGRLKRFAKIAGEMVALELVEKIAVEASPKFAHGAVSCRDPNRGEILVLFTEDRSLRREQLVEAARRLGAPEVAVPRKVEFLEKLPRLGSGKTDYVTLNQLADSPLSKGA